MEKGGLCNVFSGSGEPDMNRFGSHPKQENRPVYEGSGLRASPRHGGPGVFLNSHQSAAGVPRRGRRQSSYQMDRLVTILASYLNTTIFFGKPHFIRFSFPTCSTHIASRGCDSGGGAGKCRSPQERDENLFLSISTEPLFSQQGDKNREKKSEVCISFHAFLFPDLFNYFGL